MPGKPLDPPRPQCPWRDHAGSLCLQTPGCFQFTHLHQNGALPPMPTSPDASSTQMSPKHPAEFTVTVPGPLCECFHSCVTDKGASLVAQVGKNPPAMWETHVPSLGWEDPLEKGMAAHSHILAWRIPQRSLAGYSPLGQKRVRQDSQLTLSPSLQIKSLRCWGDPPSCAIFTLMSAGQQHVCVCVCVCVCRSLSLSLSFITSLVGGRHPSAKYQPLAPWRPLLHREAVLSTSLPTRKSEPSPRTDHSGAAALRSESGGGLGLPHPVREEGLGAAESTSRVNRPALCESPEGSPMPLPPGPGSTGCRVQAPSALG